ncbi:Hypothetical predicted protein [Cloeon dipterum]|uniref:NADH dehydrogenase [ubiquinone] 1 beta subcomplex subunit 3 n=1 Tax=Cloeon dipterum TaxID=197152 RepID=A0A8S1CAF9_9INSE|nr:Hypothetical predicted protein [Cloeon dipterum]
MGGDGHGHGHGPPYKIPDYRIYKVDGVPELMRVKTALAAKGLRDPWLRNEVWRYDPSFGTTKQRIQLTFFRGFKYGLGLALITVAIEKLLELRNPHHHGHH